ncbi:MAG: cob(I)yrinic acid a,c-diamide adenosyltransferase [Deltaproteobacteria bacterium]|nr:cob(I)yrinic acid a,c-diamide adenosyltransferase [Deltaproteobacteria bacterium]
MRISRVYTRTGDAGQTRLVGGRVVEKNHPRIEAYGTVDELNAVLGMARAFNDGSGAAAEAVSTIDGFLQTLQNDLFNVGSDLATLAADRWDGMYRVGDTEVDRLEQWCDALNEELGPLKEFILPGGGTVGASLHHARTVCRRAERRALTLMRSEEEVGEGCFRYLNRLSDFLFVLARWAARAHGQTEQYWDKPT